MALEIRPYREEDLAGMIKVWNEVVEAGEAFPQVEPLTMETARAFFAAQTLTTVAAIDDKLFGLYILHPNNVGRCVHVANASYAVASSARGLGLGRELVKDSLAQAARTGFRGLQVNAVVASTEAAILLQGLLRRGASQLRLATRPVRARLVAACASSLRKHASARGACFRSEDACVACLAARQTWDFRGCGRSGMRS